MDSFGAKEEGATSPTAASGSNSGQVWSRIASTGQFLVALTFTLGFLAYLLFGHGEHHEPLEVSQQAKRVAEVVGPARLRIEPGSPLDEKLEVVEVRTQTFNEPIVTVTGRVVASLRPGRNGGQEFWQFDRPEVLTAYTDWERAVTDIAFHETLMDQVRQLAHSRVKAQEQKVSRFERLVAAGTDTAGDLAEERATLLELEIEGRREIHQAETELAIARQTEAALARQLQQEGLDVDFLRTVTPDIDIVMADVPEGRIHQVRVGQGCRAKFFGLPRERFPGTVNSISPVLSAERRSLRVLFAIEDPDDKLRPGMFAEIGLGTDARDALFLPADAVLHVARTDYVLVAADDNEWKVIEVEVGESRQGDVEILTGLVPGDRVIGRGAILLKPLVVESLVEKDHATWAEATP